MTHPIYTQQALFVLFVDEQAVAQAELEEHIEAQAIAVALLEHQNQVPFGSAQGEPCDSAFDAVWSLSMVKVSPHIDAEQKSVCVEELLDKPFSQLTKEEWMWLREYSPQMIA